MYETWLMIGLSSQRFQALQTLLQPLSKFLILLVWGPSSDVNLTSKDGPRAERVN